MSDIHPLRRHSGLRLIESYCPSCGLLIAASPWEELLKALEKMHRCPPNTYDPDNAAALGRCRIIRYPTQ